MAELKTKKRTASVEKFLGAVKDAQTRADCQALVKLMRKATGAAPKMWGPSIVGFGDYRYKYASGREGDWFLTGFSPRKGQLSLYILSGFRRSPERMKKLGRYKTGVSCLYVKRLADVDAKVLNELIIESVRYLKKTYG
jgi:hypothetical protein